MGKNVGKAGLGVCTKGCTYIKSTHVEIVMWNVQVDIYFRKIESRLFLA